MEAFVKDAQKRLGNTPDREAQVAELGAHVKVELDKITAEVDAYNSTFREIHDAAREPGTSLGMAYGTRMRPVMQEHRLYADHDSAGRLIRIDGEEYRDLGVLGLVDDGARHVEMLNAAEIPATRHIPPDGGILN